MYGRLLLCRGKKKKGSQTFQEKKGTKTKQNELAQILDIKKMGEPAKDLQEFMIFATKLNQRRGQKGAWSIG